MENSHRIAGIFLFLNSYPPFLTTCIIMSQEPPRQFGVTPPISSAPSTEKELKLTESLVQTLKDFGLFESEQEAQKR